MSTALYDHRGRRIALGTEIGRGGEGAVFIVADHPERVAKVYHESVEPQRAAKFNAMARLGGEALLRIAAWPLGTLHRSPSGPLVGLMLPRVSGHREIHELYSPAQRRQHFAQADWSFLVHVAMNCAAAFETIHHAGHIVGDVNESGVLVSRQGTVRLIDCDSFQVTDGHTTFPCVVGVPQYTPPELQGIAFRDVHRTSDHDNFGLALLIFHLLFMGRHPFAGRFGGTGEMPIEKAIAEGRFAFGRAAALRQMQAPPHTLPLAALPPQVADLFEQAFAWPLRSLRPTAAHWYDAMRFLKGTLHTCEFERAHVYSTAAGRCPWCQIARSGGPDFFSSVDAGNADEPPYVNVAALWAEVEAIPRPPAMLPPPVHRHKIEPEPLPEALADIQLFRRITAWTGGAGLILAAMMLSPVMMGIGFGLAVMAGLVYTVLTLLPHTRQERQRRRQRFAAASAALDQLRNEWSLAITDHAAKFEEIVDRLAALKPAASRVHLDFQAELKRTEADARQHQLREFLRRHLIRKHAIAGIGAGRLSTLRSFGIETAADVDPDILIQVPGIGPQCVDALVQWRQHVETQFRYNASLGLPPAYRKSVQHRYQQLKRNHEQQFHHGIAQLKELSEAALRRAKSLLPQVNAAQDAYRQAQADVKAM